MNRALLELLALEMRGRFVRRLRLLRQPRYLIAALAGGAYFLLVVLPRLADWHSLRRQGGFGAPGSPFGGAGAGAGAAALEASGAVGAALPLAVGLLLAFGTTLVWLLSSSKPALRLSEAELHLLLPAPLTRRGILAYALLKQQVGVLVGALVLAVVRGFGPPGQRLPRFFATWTLLTLFDLHVKGVSLWKARLRELPRAQARRQIAAAGVLGALFWGALIWSLRRIVVSAAAGGGWDAASLEKLLRQVLHDAAAGLPAVLLAPFVWLSRPLFGAFSPLAAGDLRGWSVLFALAMIVVHCEWVLRSRGRFEEAALAAAQRQLRRGRHFRFRPPAARARRREPFALPPAGRPEIAIYWKNLMLRGRAPLARGAWVLAAICAVLGAVSGALGAPLEMASALVGIGLTLMLLVPPFAGLILRNDLRTDLRQAETLRAWPLEGWRFMAAEMMAPATSALYAVGAGYGLLLAGVLPGWLASGGAPLRPIFGSAGANGGGLGGISANAALVGGGLSLLPLALAVALLSIAVQNLATLLLPGWMTLGQERRRGSAFTGLRMLIVLGHLLALAVGLLPTLLLLGAALLVHRLLAVDFHLAEAPVAALLAAAPLLVEVWLLVRLGGARWQRLDPSREILETQE